MAYLIVILLAMAAIAALAALGGLALPYALSAVTLLTLSVIAIDGVLALIIRRLPARLFSCEGRLFTVGRREAAVLRALGVKRWSPLVPDLGCFTQFPKRHIARPRDPAYTGRYLLEAAYGIVIHAANIPFGFLILAILPDVALSIALPVALVNAFLSLLPLLVLRANLPALMRLHRANLARE